MICKNCGQHVDENNKFCHMCGAKLFSNINIHIKTNFEPRCWSVFANIGKVIGIVSISISWIPLLLGMIGGIHGIVLSALGLTSKNEVSRKMAKVGLILSTIATIVSFASYILLFVLLTLFG